MVYLVFLSKSAEDNLSILGRICSFVLKWVEVCCVKWVKVFTSEGGWNVTSEASILRSQISVSFHLRTSTSGPGRKVATENASYVGRWYLGLVKGLIAPVGGISWCGGGPWLNFNLREDGGKTGLCCDESCRMTAGGSFRKKRPVGGISWWLSEARRAILCRPTAWQPSSSQGGGGRGKGCVRLSGIWKPLLRPLSQSNFPHRTLQTERRGKDSWALQLYFPIWKTNIEPLSNTKMQ